MSLNKAMLIGNVGRDPEVRYLDGSNGQAKVATFTLATTERYRDRNGETRENTEWHNIVAWRQTADICEKYVKKGDQLFVEGRIKSRTWETDRGEKRYATDIVVDKIELLSKPSASQSQSAPAPAPKPRVQSVPLPQAGAPEDDDIPF